MNDTCQMWLHSIELCGAPATHAVGKTCPSGHEGVQTLCDRCTARAMSGRVVRCLPCMEAGVTVPCSFSEPVRLRVSA